MTSSIFTVLNGPCTLAVWASGDHGWRAGTLGIKIELCPDDADSGGPWIAYATYTEDVVEPLDLYGVRLRSRVVRLEDPAKDTGGFMQRWRKTPAITAPANQDVALHVAVATGVVKPDAIRGLASRRERRGRCCPRSYRPN